MHLRLLSDDRGDYFRVVLNDGQWFYIDADDEAWLEYPWRIYEFKNSNGSYVARPGSSGTILLHRELMEAPKGVFVDHRDGNRLNNRRYNLRLCTNQQNLMAKHDFKRTASGYRGVYRSMNGRWFSTISVGHQHKKRYLGTFPTPEDAARAWDAVALELRGEFAQLNFPR